MSTPDTRRRAQHAPLSSAHMFAAVLRRDDIIRRRDDKRFPSIVARPAIGAVSAMTRLMARYARQTMLNTFAGRPMFVRASARAPTRCCAMLSRRCKRALRKEPLRTRERWHAMASLTMLCSYTAHALCRKDVKNVCTIRRMHNTEDRYPVDVFSHSRERSHMDTYAASAQHSSNRHYHVAAPRIPPPFLVSLRLFQIWRSRVRQMSLECRYTVCQPAAKTARPDATETTAQENVCRRAE